MAVAEAAARVTAPAPFPRDAASLEARYGNLGTLDVIDLAVHELFPGRVALVSSFGAESSVLLHLLSEVDRDVPVVFLDTGRLFAETLEYRTRLIDHLGLTGVRTVGPDVQRVKEQDPHRALWMTNPDMCCHLRKTEPLEQALGDFDAWFTGRKRFQGGARKALPVFEADGARVKINPLARWTPEALKDHAARHRLPEHPLVSRGYLSIGCVPCTSKVEPGEDQRAGRWRGKDKVECGIHVNLEADGSGI